jgi:uncharacterized protein
MNTNARLLLPILLLISECSNRQTSIAPRQSVNRTSQPAHGQRLSAAALALTRDRVQYDPAYFRIPYPNGDVPANRGVCTDVVIRAYRKLGIDLQRLVHEDMRANLSRYPRAWLARKTDTNIDHRRVLNLMVFFARHGQSLPLSANGRDYQPGDIVAWRLAGGVTHIGVVVNQRSADAERFMIVHNIGHGQEVSDCLFDYTIIGHYRYGGSGRS